MCFNCHSLYRLWWCSFSTSKVENSQAHFMGECICILLWNVGKVSYAAASMRRIEQIHDIKASIFLGMVYSLYCSTSHCHHAGSEKQVGAWEVGRARPLLLLSP